MQTQSHALIAAALIIPLRYRRVNVHATALVIGAVLPDIPLVLLSLGGVAYYRWFAPLPATTPMMEHLYTTLFFHDPVWIASHNLFHSLLMNTLFMSIGLWGMRREKRWGATLFWLSLSMLVHAGIDIVTHRSDGPLIWFPLNWSYRFESPVSYWESDYFGRQFFVFESILDLVLAILLVVTYRPLLQAHWHRLRRNRSHPHKSASVE